MALKKRTTAPTASPTAATQSDDDADLANANATTIYEAEFNQPDMNDEDDSNEDNEDDDADTPQDQDMLRAQGLARMDQMSTRPAPATDTAPILDAILAQSAQDQWTACSDMDNFLSEIDKSPVDINDDDRLIPCMLVLPNHKIRFVYGLGYFTGGLNNGHSVSKT